MGLNSPEPPRQWRRLTGESDVRPEVSYLRANTPSDSALKAIGWFRAQGNRLAEACGRTQIAQSDALWFLGRNAP